jgi:hypothetical protein
MEVTSVKRPRRRQLAVSNVLPCNAQRVGSRRSSRLHAAYTMQHAASGASRTSAVHWFARGSGVRPGYRHGFASAASGRARPCRARVASVRRLGDEVDDEQVLRGIMVLGALIECSVDVLAVGAMRRR